MNCAVQGLIGVNIPEEIGGKEANANKDNLPKGTERERQRGKGERESGTDKQTNMLSDYQTSKLILKNPTGRIIYNIIEFFDKIKRHYIINCKAFFA